MIHSTYIPQSPLSEFVDSFWYHEGFDLPHSEERHLPIGTVELVFNLYHRNRAVCRGPSSEPALIETAQQSSLIGVHFKPSGAFPFFDLPLGELHNLQVSLADLWGAKVDDICEQLLAVGTAAARFRLLEEALLARIALP